MDIHDINTDIINNIRDFTINEKRDPSVIIMSLEYYFSLAEYNNTHICNYMNNPKSISDLRYRGIKVVRPGDVKGLEVY